MKDKSHWRHRQQKRLEHADERRRRHEIKKARCARLGIPLRPPGLYKKSGGQPAAMAWFAALTDEAQRDILGLTPSIECRRGKGKAVIAFQRHLVEQRDRATTPKE